VEEKEYYQMIDWIDERIDEIQQLIDPDSAYHLPGHLENYNKGRLNALKECRTMITYVREGTLNQVTLPWF